MTAQAEWSYVKTKHGTLAIVDTTSDNITRTSGDWRFIKGNHNWLKIDPKTHTPETSCGYNVSFIDLSDVPEPTWEGGPISIILTASVKYYYTD